MQFEKIDKGETCVLILHENIEFYGGLNLKKALDEILKEKYKHIIIEMENHSWRSPKKRKRFGTESSSR